MKLTEHHILVTVNTDEPTEADEVLEHVVWCLKKLYFKSPVKESKEGEVIKLRADVIDYTAEKKNREK